MDLAAFDVRHIAAELAQLVGAKVEKVMQGEKLDLLITMYLKDHPKLHVRILPGTIALHEEKPGHYPQVPPGFAMFLRKYLGNARLVAARQRGFDRIVDLDFEGFHGKMTLVVELMPPGNVVLVLDEKIKGVLDPLSFKDRQLRGGLPYTPPPPAKDLATMSDAALADVLATSSKDKAVTALAIDLGLGGIYAEEACARANVDRHASALDGLQIAALVEGIRMLFAAQAAPCADASRAYPIEMRSRAAIPSGTSFLRAIGSKLDAAPSLRGTSKKVPKDKLETMRVAQEKQIRRLEAAAALEQRSGERIYEQYHVLKEIFDAVADARAKKQDLAAALARFPIVKRFDPATFEIEVEL